MKISFTYQTFAIKSYYFLFSFGLGILFGFLPVYFGKLGFSGKEVSSIIGLGSLFGAFGVALLWGWISDQIQKPNLILKILAFGSTIGFIPLLFTKDYWPVFGFYSIFAFCSIGVMSILDAVASLRAKEKRQDFGRIRLYAPAGWLVGSVGLGAFFKYTDKSFDNILVIVAIVLSFGLMFLISLGMKNSGTEQQEKPKLKDIRAIFNSKYMVVFYIMALVNFIALASYMVFYGPLIESKSMSPFVLGLGLGVGTLTEVIFMFFFEKFKKWLGLDLIIILSIAISIIRWIIIAQTNSAVVLVLIQVLHSEIGLFVLACVSFVTDSVPKRMVVTGQAVFYTATYGIGQYLGIMLMGYLKDYFGDVSKLFLVSSIIHIVPLVLAMYNLAHVKKVKEENMKAIE